MTSNSAYGNGPKVHEHKHHDEQAAVQREEEGENVVWDSLGPAVNRVESMRRVGRGEAVGVVRLVDVAVQKGEVQATMDEIDGHVGAEKEQWNGEQKIAPTVVVNIVIHLAVALCHEHREGRHE